MILDDVLNAREYVVFAIDHVDLSASFDASETFGCIFLVFHWIVWFQRQVFDAGAMLPPGNDAIKNNELLGVLLIILQRVLVFGRSTEYQILNGQYLFGQWYHFGIMDLCQLIVHYCRLALAAALPMR